ncbi:chemotaxis protein CheW [Hassallia byssoidea VB512170]|uniref:Chemotaxis protein CheW n=1 Tax=Hassallia byssoidea VB512170 TaxID=1304833 RepID=A0A846H7M1_9CYAN|nr:chemotaxis protein CheW [Hassalia byssoidea]NEU73103.1 chemotaxis protein CheW [Hassalia byssoidea VB512170]
MNSEQKFLSFNLGAKDTAVISLQHITEVLQVSLTEICGVPQMPSCVLGIYNWRGEMLWLVDLQNMLGYTPLSQGVNLLSKMMALVVQNEGKSLGLLVRQLIDIELLDTKQIKFPNAELFSREMSDFLQGYFINDSEEMIIAVDAAAIIQASIWEIHN